MKLKPKAKTDLSNSGPIASLKLSAIEYLHPSTLRRYEGKLRKLPEKQIAKLASSIGVFGFINPIIVDVDGVIVAG